MISKIIDGTEENVSGGSAGGGHVIENQSGTDMIQRANLQFIDAQTSDDSTNNRTKVELLKELANASDLASQPDGLYLVPEADPTDIAATQISYDNTTSGLSATEVQDAIDEINSSKISKSQTSGLIKNDGTVDTENYSDEIDAITNLYVSKNLLLNCLTSTASQTISGITFTFNADGSITLSGKLDAGVSYTGLNLNSGGMYIPASDLILSGIPSSVHPYVAIQIFSDDWTIVQEDNGNGKEFNGAIFSGKNIYARIIAYEGADFTNNPVTVYPMLRDARISDDTYVPYVMTNKELSKTTEAITGGYSQWIAGTSYVVGDVIIYNNILYSCIANNSSNTKPDQRVGQYWKVISIKELTAKKADKVVPATSGNLATLDSSGNLTDGGMHPLYLIERVGSIPTQGGGNTIITFSGNAICRFPHYMLLLCGQGGCSSPIIVGFSGQYGTAAIQGVFVSDTLGFIQISGTSIIIPDGFSGWGDGLIFNLLPQDNVEFTVTRGT